MHLQIRSGRTTSSSGGIVPRIFYDALLYLQHRCNLAFLCGDYYAQIYKISCVI